MLLEVWSAFLSIRLKEFAAEKGPKPCFNCLLAISCDVTLSSQGAGSGLLCPSNTIVDRCSCTAQPLCLSVARNTILLTRYSVLFASLSPHLHLNLGVAPPPSSRLLLNCFWTGGIFHFFRAKLDRRMAVCGSGCSGFFGCFEEAYHHTNWECGLSFAFTHPSHLHLLHLS